MKSALFAALAVVIGCAVGSPGVSGSPLASVASLAPVSSPSPSAIPSPTEDLAVAPPDGSLSAGGQSVVGWPGSYCWRDACLDAPMLPDKAALPKLTVPAGTAELLLTVSSGAGFTRWSARYSSDANGSDSELGSGGERYDPDLAGTPPPDIVEAQVAPPPPGDWVVVVQVAFVDGDATFAWHVIVP